MAIGRKTRLTNGLRNQQLKWGEITNNEIVAMGTVQDTDGMTLHHFVGKIANNRVRAPKLPIVIDRWMLTTRARFPLLDERPHAW
ncbi:MAG: hypothetical protein CME06_02665 [Gemmatimonadetes bacterium]|nr:hypothetical protein [Gemmatimonadota bacterium]